MKVREKKFELQLPRDGSRSPGLHLSEILRDLALQWKILDAKYDVPVENSDTTLMQVGLGWENYLAQFQHPEIEFHPGELKLDGIAMSPDGISVRMGDDGTLTVGIGHHRLHEFKFTRKSSKEFRQKILVRSPKVLLWLWQIMAYRHALNVMLVGIGCPASYDAELHVMFINGNYSWDESDPESAPSYKIFEITFRPEELDENWAMILNHAKVMRKKGRIAC